MTDRSRILAQLAGAVVDSQTGTPLALRLCRTFVDMVRADGGAITLAYTKAERVGLCVTDAMADRLEDLQEVIGEGPGPDAYTTGHLVTGTLNDNGVERWPMLAEAVRSIVGSVTLHAFPMRSAGDVIGVLTVYQARHRPLGQDAGDAQFLADAVGAAIVRDSGPQADLESARWDIRDKIHQATGMVVAQLATNPADALAMLRAFAFSQGLSLEHAASEVIERRYDFSRDADDNGQEGDL